MTDSLCWRIKTHLQWTGWLQYIPNVTAVLLSFLLACLGGLVAGQVLFCPLALLSCLLLLILVFDLCTVKCGLRPWEPSPARCDDLDAFDLMRKRRSCRSFQARSLSTADLGELMECVQHETDPSRLLGSCPIRLDYVAAPLTVWPVVGGHEFLVAIAPREYSREAVIDVGRCLQKAVLHATRMGLATCWIGPGADHESVMKHLGDRFNPSNDHIICICAVGYSSNYIPASIRLIQRVQRNRMPLSALFFAGPCLQEPLAVHLHPWSQYGRCYEVCQWSPSSFNGQPIRCVGTASGKRFDFYTATQSRFYAPVALGIWLANWETGCAALGIRGRFQMLTQQERAIKGVRWLSDDSPRYDVSWLADDK
ncbi:unnamed protein product [Polarella glacialis]|uniref:Putative nitroreductase TM1586 domain-containing protein n=1 Tax=Polarella glacialis TaxID=89957 RepID=A0A813DXR9_POLGL|nr:unnamed protein product [Polarella glacialis]CAE8652483.1 unnamed protein product [Polarella glacialis]